MPRRSPETAKPTADEVTQALLTATVGAAVQPIKAEMRWQRWLLFALVAAVFSPKLGGPSAPQVAAIAADPALAHSSYALLRAYLAY